MSRFITPHLPLCFNTVVKLYGFVSFIWLHTFMADKCVSKTPEGRTWCLLFYLHDLRSFVYSLNHAPTFFQRHYELQTPVSIVYLTIPVHIVVAEGTTYIVSKYTYQYLL